MPIKKVHINKNIKMLNSVRKKYINDSKIFNKKKLNSCDSCLAVED